MVTGISLPILFAAIVYPLVGMRPGISNFFTYAAFLVLCNLTATSMALAISTWARTVDLAVSILPLMLEISRLFGGFFLPPAVIPGYFSWLVRHMTLVMTHSHDTERPASAMCYVCEAGFSNPWCD
jgi:ATP-binding cassette, subfamily G (WHITE), member 2